MNNLKSAEDWLSDTRSMDYDMRRYYRDSDGELETIAQTAEAYAAYRMDGLLAELSKHVPSWVSCNEGIIRGYGQCSCGEAKATGTEPYRFIWERHIREVVDQLKPGVTPFPDNG